jgi:nitrogen fixation NifU-like protein
MALTRRRQMTHEHEVGLSAVASDHALHPRHYGSLRDYSGHARIKGPCGDTMEFWVDVEAGRVRRTSFVTDGCGSARACGDMAATLSEDRPLDAALALQQAHILEALGGLPAATEHCALLAANTLHAACRDSLQGRPEAGAPAHGERRTQEDTR